MPGWRPAAECLSRNTVTIRAPPGSGYRDPGLAWIVSCPLPRSSRPNLRDSCPAPTPVPLSACRSPSRLDFHAATFRATGPRPGDGRAQGALRRPPPGRRAPGGGRRGRAGGRVRGAGCRRGRARGDAGQPRPRAAPGRRGRPGGAARRAATAAGRVPGCAGADVPDRPGRHGATGQHQGQRAARLRGRLRGRQALHRICGPALPGRGAKPARRGRPHWPDQADPVPAAPGRGPGGGRAHRRAGPAARGC